MSNFESILNRAEENVESFRFSSLSREFRECIKQTDGLSREQQNNLWGRHKSLFERHIRWKENFVHESKMARGRLEHELYSIDVCPDGAPAFNSPLSRYERVGDKIRAAREQYKILQAKIKQTSLTKDDRDSLRNLANDYWYKIKNAEERLCWTHKDRADSLYNQAHDAVEYKTLREARDIHKNASAEVRALYLNRDDRETMKSRFDDLWQKLQYRQDEEARQWRERTEQQLYKLAEIRDQKERTLERVRDNNSNNYNKLSDARSDSYRDCLENWISEGEDKVRLLEENIDNLNEKIAAIRGRLDR